ncbi:MAG: hypothetical protein FWC68_02685 [Oscillospiraceae bacterium]|nr:hypothetical protein [Oscillospiraceae bacterium]
MSEVYDNEIEIDFEYILNKHILVGLTYQDKEGNVLERIQFHGDVVVASQEEGIAIEIEDTEEIFVLPPDIRSIHIAEPGEYRLDSSGEVVVNPDLLTTWIITRNPEGDEL